MGSNVKHQVRYVKMKNGRKQKAIVLASGKLKFVKNDSGGSPRKAKKHVAKKSKAMTKHRKHYAKKTHRRGRRRSAGLSPMTLGIAGLGLGYLSGSQGPTAVKNFAAKIPGTKTLGPVATLGLACFAINKWVKPNKYLKYAGYIGIAAAALKIGDQGSNMKWVGEPDISGYDLEDVDDLEDVEDVEDIEDVDDVEDVEGDD